MFDKCFTSACIFHQKGGEMGMCAMMPWLWGDFQVSATKLCVLGDKSGPDCVSYEFGPDRGPQGDPWVVFHVERRKFTASRGALPRLQSWSFPGEGKRVTFATAVFRQPLMIDARYSSSLADTLSTFTLSLITPPRMINRAQRDVCSLHRPLWPNQRFEDTQWKKVQRC